MKFNVIVRCTFCGSDKTYFEKRRQIFYWRKIKGKTACHKCYSKRRVVSLGKRIQSFDKEMVGICSICNRSVAKGEIKQTQFHHINYDESDILKDTIEICAKCHYNTHKETRVRNELGRFVSNK